MTAGELAERGLAWVGSESVSESGGSGAERNFPEDLLCFSPRQGSGVSVVTGGVAQFRELTLKLQSVELPGQALLRAGYSLRAWVPGLALRPFYPSSQYHTPDGTRHHLVGVYFSHTSEVKKHQGPDLDHGRLVLPVE